MKIDDLIKRYNSSSVIKIESLCKMKKYLPVEKKFEMLDEFDRILDLHLSDHENFKQITFYVFFNLLFVKYYTDIEFDLTYESYDKLQENGIIMCLMNNLEEEYMFLYNAIGG